MTRKYPQNRRSVVTSDSRHTRNNEILRLAKLGRTNASIASWMGIPKNTVAKVISAERVAGMPLPKADIHGNLVHPPERFYASGLTASGGRCRVAADTQAQADGMLAVMVRV